MKTPADMAKSLKKVKKLGYDAVQLSGQGEVSDKEMKKMVDDAGLIICALIPTMSLCAMSLRR